MGRWDDGKGGLAHREGIREEHRRGEVGAARSATNLCSALPRIGRGVGADPISLGACFGANYRTLPWLQATNSISRQRSHWHRAEPLRWLRRSWKVCRQSTDNRPRFCRRCNRALKLILPLREPDCDRTDGLFRVMWSAVNLCCVPGGPLMA